MPDPGDSAESYLLSHLSPSDARAFEDHYLCCPRCAKVVEETERYIRAMKGALRELRE